MKHIQNREKYLCSLNGQELIDEIIKDFKKMSQSKKKEFLKMLEDSLENDENLENEER